jgi:hypothetical protein
MMGTCTAINFAEGSRRALRIKGVGICDQVPDIDPALFERMKTIARQASTQIGVYMRIDMFVGANGQIYLQEFSSNHLGGRRHCSAKRRDDGCVDSCFLGDLWRQIGLATGADFVMGGRQTIPPDTVLSFMSLDDVSSQCQAVLQINPNMFAPPIGPGTSEPSASPSSILELPRACPADIPSGSCASGLVCEYNEGRLMKCILLRDLFLK